METVRRGAGAMAGRVGALTRLAHFAQTDTPVGPALAPNPPFGTKEGLHGRA